MLRRSIRVNDKKFNFLLVIDRNTEWALFKSLLSGQKHFKIPKTIYKDFDIVLFRRGYDLYDLCIGVI